MNFQQKYWCDRFIPTRVNMELANFNLTHSNLMSFSDCQVKDEDKCFMEPIFANTAKIARNKLKNEEMLLKVMGINHSKILKGRSKRKEKITVANFTPLWPVFARAEPSIYKPETVLDMPQGHTFTTTQYRHMIDWSKRGLFASISNGEVHVWNPDQNLTVSTNTRESVVSCVKFNKSGTHIAVCIDYKTLAIIEVQTLQIVDINNTCMCPIASPIRLNFDSHISAIEWSQLNVLIKGCCNGTIDVINCEPWGKSYSLGVYRRIELKHKDYITDLKLSCNESYLLISTAKGTIYIGYFNTNKQKLMSPKEIHMIFKSSLRNILSASWHPWSEHLLAIGETNNRITVLNVKSSKILASNVVEPYFKKSEHCALDFITFNPISAELVVSFYYKNPENQSGCNFITVLKNLNTKVDEVRYHIGKVPHMLWDREGVQLATFGADENLVIWDFFGKSPGEMKAILKLKRKYTKFNPPMFGQCIR